MVSEISCENRVGRFFERGLRCCLPERGVGPRQSSLRCILDFERSRNQRQGSEFCEVVSRFAFLINGVLKVTRGGIELTTPVL